MGSDGLLSFKLVLTGGRLNEEVTKDYESDDFDLNEGDIITSMVDGPKEKLYTIWKPSRRFQLMDLDNEYYIVKFQAKVDYWKALTEGSSRSFQAPTGWAGRFWGRTGCNFDDSGHGSCATGDCGSGEMECNGAGAIPPATLAEFTLGSGSQDFYDVSLVDGYNLPMIVEGSGGSGECATTGCLTDLNKKCPSELKIDGGAACKSACDAFGKPEYCCSGAYNSPTACKPSMYSQVFKSACPKSYSYAFDDATSTFTCSGADYAITFCPNVPSLKSSKDPAAAKATGSDPDSDPMQASALASQWLANLATGDSIKIRPFSLIRSGFAITIFLVLSFLF
ncbi:hypothetical protein GOBAR_AA38173 [Gossypium barbadense]|uniref:Uncharacterized protein n=1 Tax=Gossypium barbadense TaxID=3634 RepID=A0A2P5VUL9_GOSBA|nr:hypothetical protein GOBAR_AA38173 [Gossypium barbadense]